MRISTSGLHRNALTAMLAQQTTLAKTQAQLAAGKRVQTPADDPVAAVHILELQRALQESDQFAANSNVAGSRLKLEEQALADAGALLQRVRELTIQGNSGSVDAGSRRLIATEVRARLQELTDLANRRDANNEYLFAGYSTRTQPFTQNAASVIYGGDQGGRVLQVGPTQRIADSHSGYEVFVNIAEGNGVFVADAAAANTGSGIVAGSSVNDPGAWAPDDYTLNFITPTSWEVVDSSAAVVTAGTYTPPAGSISFNGISVNLTGAPAAGDAFSIDRSRTEDLFATLQDLAAALESGTTTTAQQAQFGTDIGRALQQLDAGMDHLLTVRAEVGTRLSSLESQDSSRADERLEIERRTSELRDLDYAEAITRMNQQLVGLQAAQASYSRISQLSLFDYLR